MKKDSDYLVRDPRLIAEHLTDIVRKKCIISAEFGENKASFLTAITEIDIKSSVLKLDSGPTELLTNQLLNSETVLFRTEMDGIKVSFGGKGIKKSKSNDHPAFEMPIPSTLFWMQRRQFYRVKIPLSHVGSFCEIVLRVEHADGRVETQCTRFQLLDISICGFSLLNPDAALINHFEPGQCITQCTLYLHEGAHSSTDIVVKYVSTIKISAMTTQHRIGCVFTGLTPAFESSVLRYMQDIERQTRKIASS